MQSPRVIVCAAIRNGNGDVICGARHYDKVMHSQIAKTGGRDNWRGAEQGFIDQWCEFVTREEARQIAMAAGQIRRRCGGDEKRLYSENLY